MARLIGRKLLLLILLLPLLHALGFHYAVAAPQMMPDAHAHFRDLVQTESTYEQYLSQILAGNLGSVGALPISEIVVMPVRNSLILLIAAVTIMVILGPLLGFLSISSRTRRLTPLGLLLSTAGLSLPRFFLGGAIIALMIYGVFLSRAGGTLLPLSGFGLDKHLILPVLVLASAPTLQIAGVTANLLEHELQQDYIRVAQSKGLNWPLLLWRHAFPNIISPVMVTIGRTMRFLIGGLIVVEALFLWPGLGRIFMFVMGIRIDGREPIHYFLHPELMATVAVLFGVWLLLADLVTGALAQWLDPRFQQSSD